MAEIIIRRASKRGFYFTLKLQAHETGLVTPVRKNCAEVWGIVRSIICDENIYWSYARQILDRHQPSSSVKARRGKLVKPLPNKNKQLKKEKNGGTERQIEKLSVKIDLSD